MRKRVIKQEVEENSLVIQYFCASTLYVPICWLIVILFCKLWGEEEHPVPYLDSAYHNGISILHNGKRFLCFGMPISIITKILRITKESMEFFFLKTLFLLCFPSSIFLNRGGDSQFQRTRSWGTTAMSKEILEAMDFGVKQRRMYTKLELSGAWLFFFFYFGPSCLVSCHCSDNLS